MPSSTPPEPCNAPPPSAQPQSPLNYPPPQEQRRLQYQHCIQSITRAAKPTRKIFDPWNTASTGHQRAENRLAGSPSWRESRTLKLAHQLADASGTGGRRIYDTVGAGSKDFGVDGRLENGGWRRGASGLRKNGQLSLQECIARCNRPMHTTAKAGVKRGDEFKENAQTTVNADYEENVQATCDAAHKEVKPTHEQGKIPLFRNLTFYINGSTYPLVSDHMLKRLLRQHGGNLSLGLGRRTVTHVLIGTPNDGNTYTGAGGGLAAMKIQKEVALVRGQGVKYVTANWVMDSIKAGKRLPESRYACLKLAHSKQKSVHDALLKTCDAETI